MKYKISCKTINIKDRFLRKRAQNTDDLQKNTVKIDYSQFNLFIKNP